MAIEIVDFPSKNGDFPWQNVSSPEGKWLFHVGSKPGEVPLSLRRECASRWSSDRGHGREQGGKKGHGEEGKCPCKIWDPTIILLFNIDGMVKTL